MITPRELLEHLERRGAITINADNWTTGIVEQGLNECNLSGNDRLCELVTEGVTLKIGRPYDIPER